MSVISVEEIKMELDPLCQDFEYIGDEENDDQSDSLEDRCRSKLEAIPKNLVGFFEFSGISLAKGSQGPNKILKCLTCNHKRTSSGSSTGNFVTHLKTHPDVYKRYLQVRQQRKADANQNRSVTWLQQNHEVSTKHQPQLLVRENSPPETESTLLSRTDRLNELLLRSVVEDQLPSRLLNSTAFRRFLGELDHSYDPPLAEGVAALMNSRIEVHRMKMSSILGALSSRTVFHLTCDVWTTAEDKGILLFVKIHYIDDEWKLCRVPLAVRSLPSSCSSERIQQLLKDLLNRLELSLVNVGTVCFNIANETLAAFANVRSKTRREDEELEAQALGDQKEGIVIREALVQLTDAEIHVVDPVVLSGTEQLSCIVHQLQRILRSALENSAQQKALEDIWTVVKFLRQSSVGADRLYGLTRQQLVNRDPLLWDSNHYALDWIIQVHPHLSVVLAEARRDDGANVPRAELREKAYYSELLAILDAFREASTTLQADGVTSSLVLPTLVGLSNFLAERKLDCKILEHVGLLEKLQTGLKDHFRDTATHTVWTMSTLLDPRFGLEFFRNAEKIRAQHPDLLTLSSAFLAESILRKAVENLEPVPVISSRPSGTNPSSGDRKKSPGGSLIDSLMRKCRQQAEERNMPAELRLFLSNATEYDPQMNPLQFWSNFSSGFATLSRLARKYLSIPATCWNLDKLLDIAGSITRASRTGMESKQLEEVLLLRELMTS